MRRDQIDAFIVIATGDRVVWMPDYRFLYHATSDQLHAICKPTLGLSEEYRPSIKTNDRSNDLMTCGACADMVRRKKMRTA